MATEITEESFFDDFIIQNVIPKFNIIPEPPNFIENIQKEINNIKKSIKKEGE